ncbi:MAG: hypothetical protein ACYC26_15510 [Phycisphaerales bacterium]
MAEKRWLGTVDIAWDIPGNWLPAGLPQDGDAVRFVGASQGMVRLCATGPANPVHLASIVAEAGYDGIGTQYWTLADNAICCFDRITVDQIELAGHMQSTMGTTPANGGGTSGGLVTGNVILSGDFCRPYMLTIAGDLIVRGQNNGTFMDWSLDPICGVWVQGRLLVEGQYAEINGYRFDGQVIVTGANAAFWGGSGPDWIECRFNSAIHLFGLGVYLGTNGMTSHGGDIYVYRPESFSLDYWGGRYFDGNHGVKIMRRTHLPLYWNMPIYLDQAYGGSTLGPSPGIAGMGGG